MNCIGKIRFVVKIVNNKVVDNLLILLVSNFQDNRPTGLRVIAVRIWSSEILTLFYFWTDLRSLPVLARIVVESAFGD